MIHIYFKKILLVYKFLTKFICVVSKFDATFSFCAALMNVLNKLYNNDNKGKKCQKCRRQMIIKVLILVISVPYYNNYHCYV